MVSILIRTIFIYVLLNIMLKLMGKRQIGELEVNELVSTLLISEIAAIPISETDEALIPSIIPIVFIAAIEVILSVIKNHSATVKRMVEGEPVYIIYKGRLIQEALEENRISINELLSEMRTQGIGDIREVRYAILEQNGNFSLLKNSDRSNITQALVIDSKPEESAMKNEGLDKKWLDDILREKKTSIEEVLLLTLSEDGKIDVIKKEKK